MPGAPRSRWIAQNVLTGAASVASLYAVAYRATHGSFSGMRKGQDIRRPSSPTAAPYYFSSFMGRYAY